MENESIPIPKPVNPDLIKDQFQSFYELITILRAECPWDKKQTHESISHLFIEEAYTPIGVARGHRLPWWLLMHRGAKFALQNGSEPIRRCRL